MKRARIITVSALLSVLALFVLMTLYFFWEPSDVRPGSLAYRFKIPSIIQEFPLWHAVTAPSYRTRLADGEKPSFIGLNYISSATLDELRAQLTSQQFSCYFSGENQDFCKRSNTDGSTIEVTLSPAVTMGATNIDVGFIDY